jgi:hypothetical protein
MEIGILCRNIPEKVSVFVQFSALSKADMIEKKRGRVIAETSPFPKVVKLLGT